MAVKPSQYAPSFLMSALRSARSTQLIYADVSGTNFLSTSSFYYDVPGSPLKSSQQLNVDWSNFQNHVFFNSAEVKVNTAFDQIINGYPFDGSSIELEQFFERLTGFDKWVFDKFPKYKGALGFSGSYIVVNDFAGGLFPDISPNKSTGQSVLNPGTGSLSIEMQLYVPVAANDNQVICSKFASSSGFMLALSSSASTSTCNVVFMIGSGTLSVSTTAPVMKGTYTHICAVFDRDTASNVASLYMNEELTSRSQAQQYFGTFDIDETPFYIGTGSQFSAGGLTFLPKQSLSGSMDELRVFHSVRNTTSQKAFARKALSSTIDLKLYYRFNEPPPPLSSDDNDSTSAIVIDSSGKALHASVTNFAGSLRIESGVDSPMTYEKDLSAPVLFPAHPGVVALNVDLMTSASDYDKENPNIITRLIPEHYILDGMEHDGLIDKNGTFNQSYADLTTSNIHGTTIGSTQLLLSLMYILARFFDEMKLYVDTFPTVRYVDYDNTDTVPDNFLPKLLKRFGFDLPPLFNDATISQYINAENIDYDISTSLYPLKFIQNQLLRHVLLNIRSIMLSKGTQHSIKAFLRAIGIDPDNSMRFREYGGPTFRTLDFARERKYDIGTMVKFTSASLVTSPYLSGSRREVGFPNQAGTMVQKQTYNPHGISDLPSDGLFTSGSWTYEVTVKYTPEQIQLMKTAQSVGRLCGSSSLVTGPNCLFANLVLAENIAEGDWNAHLYLCPDASASPQVLHLVSPGISIVDHDKWRLSFGCVRNDATGSIVSSSYFLRVGKVDASGDIEYNFMSSSFFYEGSFNAFRQVSTASISGAFVALGSNQTIPSAAGKPFLNNSSISSDVRTTNFCGQASHMKFWSKAITETEWKEHLRNYKSAGVEHPTTNYNFAYTPSGSFEHLRLDALAKQDTLIAQPTVPNALTGSIRFIDFSQNNMHLSGTGFDTAYNCVLSEIYHYSYVSPYFDESSNDIKIRARSFLQYEKLKDNPWAMIAPVYEIIKSEEPTDDTRFVIEFSLIDALNRDIITMFGTLDDMNNAIGNPELVYSPDYPTLENMREIYFNRLSSKLNFKAFFEFYRWFDTSIGTFIQQLVPRKTRFKGTNFTIESHMLERHKLKYLSDGIYLGEDNREDLDKQILLQYFDVGLRKY